MPSFSYMQDQALARYRTRIAEIKKEFRAEVRRILDGIKERKLREVKQKISS